MDVLNKLKEQAHDLDARFRAEKVKIGGNKELSPEGKAKALEGLKTRFDGDLRALQARGRDELTQRKAQITDRLGKATSQRAEDLRKALGDTLTADIMRQRVTAATNGELADWFARPKGQWETILIRELGDIELASRSKGGSAPDSDYMRAVLAWNALDAATTTGGEELQALQMEARTLQDVGGLVDALDVATARARLGVVMGIPEKYLIEDAVSA